MGSSSGWIKEHTRRYLPLICSGNQPYDDPMESKHVAEWIILSSCVWWLCVYLFIPYSK